MATFFFSFGSNWPGAAFEVQRAVGEMGVALPRLVPDFHEDVGAGVLRGASQLYHLVATSDVRPLVTGRFGGPIYTVE